ncbi:MAG: hypothetical protein ACKOYM_06700 [Actinomycetes bacterium]
MSTFTNAPAGDSPGDDPTDDIVITAPPDGVHYLAVQHAFTGKGEQHVRSGNIVAAPVPGDPTAAFTVRASSGEEFRFVASRPAHLVETLERLDLTYVRDAPLVLFNPVAGILLVAHGSVELTGKVYIVFACELDETGSAVAIVAPDDNTPGWQVFKVRPAK